MWLTVNLVLYGAWNLTLSGVVVDSVYHLVEQGIGGIVIALVYGPMSTERSS